MPSEADLGKNREAKIIHKKWLCITRPYGPVASMGLTRQELATDTAIQIIEEHRLSYRKLVMREGRLVGAQLVGETSAAGQLVQYFDRGDPLPQNPLEALCSFSTSGSTGMAASSQICNCNTVSEAAIVKVISEGADKVDAVGAACRAARAAAGQERPTPSHHARVSGVVGQTAHESLHPGDPAFLLARRPLHI